MVVEFNGLESILSQFKKANSGAEFVDAVKHYAAGDERSNSPFIFAPINLREAKEAMERLQLTPKELACVRDTSIGAGGKMRFEDLLKSRPDCSSYYFELALHAQKLLDLLPPQLPARPLKKK